ncbi:MAG TPA: ABC transporter permease, partial [Puia sp.]|nr:ABC transporter permease [Puia sp.]
MKTIIRNLSKNKIFTFINIAGLSIGMAACLLILQYVSFELSFDEFNEQASDLYRVGNDRYQNGKLVQHGTITYSAIGKAMQDDFPEVINHTRVEPFGSQIISWKDKKMEIKDVLAVDNSFLSMFSYPLVAGDKLNALKEPNSVVISETTAKKIFDVKDNDYQSVIGKAFVISRDSMPYKVTAICKDVPENSHLQFDCLMSYVSLYSGGNGNWKESEYDFTDSDFWHYIQLKKGTNYKLLESKFAAFSQRHFQGNKVSGSDEKFHLQPISKAHLYSDYEYEIGKTGSATVVWGLLIIALFIIAIAWVNYVNLATARSVERAKEVGIRKVAGASKGQLIRQFLAESLFVNLIALLIALGLVWVLQDSFNRLIGFNLSMSYLFTKGLSGYSITIGLMTMIMAGILISGFYPAFVLSSFRPALVLKGKFSNSSKGILLRKSLVIGQFAITVALIIGSFVVYKQLRFVNSQELGMNIDQMLMVNGPSLTTWDSTFISRENSLKEEIKKLPGIKGVATTDRPMTNEMARAFNVRRKGADPKTNMTIRNFGASSEFINVYGIKLLAGRNFTPTDYNYEWRNLHNLIMNQSALKALGFSTPTDAIGQSITVFNRPWDIIGVIADFHQKSLHHAIE